VIAIDRGDADDAIDARHMSDRRARVRAGSSCACFASVGHDPMMMLMAGALGGAEGGTSLT
jgi:hypothetical protein